MFSDHDETSPSIAAVTAPSVACSMLGVQRQKRLCRQFVDVSAARRGCHTKKYTMVRRMSHKNKNIKRQFCYNKILITNSTDKEKRIMKTMKQLTRKQHEEVHYTGHEFACVYTPSFDV